LATPDTAARSQQQLHLQQKLSKGGEGGGTQSRDESEGEEREETVRLGSLLARTSISRERVLESIGWPRLDAVLREAELSAWAPADSLRFVDPEHKEAAEEAEALGLSGTYGGGFASPMGTSSPGHGELPMGAPLEPQPIDALPPPAVAGVPPPSN